MFSERLFRAAFLISLAAHAIVLVQSPIRSLFSTPKFNREPQINYLRPAQEKIYPKLARPLNNEPALKSMSGISVNKKILIPSLDGENIFKTHKVSAGSDTAFIKPVFTKTGISAFKKKIVLSAADTDKINNRFYAAYFQDMRNRIKVKASESYFGQEAGEIRISFIISREGYLKELRLLDQESSSSPYLREIAVKIVKGSFPFASFPKELDCSQLSFNLSIIFEPE